MRPISAITMALAVLYLSGCASLYMSAVHSAIELTYSPQREIKKMREEWPNTDFDQRNIELEKVLYGYVDRNHFPSLDNPKFVSVEAAAEWLEPRQPVIIIEIDGIARAYPIQILIYHELVNDQLGQTPVLVSYCPLCNTPIVYDRRLDGLVLEFGVTGALYKSDMVMFDRQTESWWQQFDGRGVVGENVDKFLKTLSSAMVAFEDFASDYPAGMVLSRDTGYDKRYGVNPYAGYDNVDNSPFLYFDPLDDRLLPKERLVGVTIGGVTRAYPFSQLKKQPLLYDTVAGDDLVIFSRSNMAASLSWGRTVPAASIFRRKLNGKTLTFVTREGRIFDKISDSEWNLLGVAVNGPLAGERLEKVDRGVVYAFAWFSFFPESEVFAAQ